MLEAVYAQHAIYARYQAVLRAARAAANSEDSETLAVEALQKFIEELRAESLFESDLRLYA
ncbi:hypothetical protein C5C44_03175 [Rathayibacter sp. AY1F6]|uniref:hypothetical protein n=1 Tax=Rathayibacter sp. AY1F6 TaxID=2080560 RepID=UPI000CE8C04B|nr:hypothetical protein [Rathayibacter sp. AY1F6]PPH05739.1 hypothetical protein C5C44_03175 [Rathayibacter sp. AY1F6]